MKFVKTIRRVLDHDAEGLSVRGEINAVVAANVEERGGAARTEDNEPQPPAPEEKPPRGEASV